jgi:hypothetical protein
LACSDGTTYGPRELKLLTRVEFQNSIEDLVGIDFDVADSIPFDTLIEGYTNNAFTSVTESHADAYLTVAKKVAAWSAERNFQGVVDCGFDGNGNASLSYQECQTLFFDDFATRVFRRPLTSAERTTYQALFDSNLTGDDISIALELGITALLSSPRFLYRSEAGTSVQSVEDGMDVSTLDSDAYVLSDYELASFLSYTITGSTPDDTLLSAAGNGELSTEDQVRQQIARLLATDSAKEHMGVFAAQWLGSDEVAKAQKDSDLFPDFTTEVAEAMAAEVKAFFTHVFYDESQGFSDLFSADYILANNALANYYGLGSVGTDSSDPNDFVRVDATSANRGGLMTIGAFLANEADLTKSSPIKRAANVRIRILCQDIPQPDDSIPDLRLELMDELMQELNGQVITTREFIAEITKNEPCSFCHDEIINPLGFTFEDFDASGRHITVDHNGLSIDSTGTLYGVTSLYDGGTMAFAGAKDLSNKFAELDVVQNCFSANVFRYAMDIGHDAIDVNNDRAGELTDEEKEDYGCSVDTLSETLGSSNSMSELFTELGTLDVVRFRKQRDR